MKYAHAIKEFVKYLLPLIFTLINLYYLLKPGYAGFVDNPGLAPTLDNLFKMFLRTPWAFWYVPGALLPAVINFLLNNSVLSWKISIIVYQYVSFIVVYKALSILKNIISISKSNKYLEVATYILAFSYSFNVYIIGGLFNYYLFQFLTPQIFMPLFIVNFLEFLQRVNSRKFISGNDVLKYAVKFFILGFFVSTSPAAIFMYSVVFFLVLCGSLTNLIKIGKKYVLMTVALFIFLYMVSISLALIHIFFLNTYEQNMQRYFSGVEYNGYPLAYVLTFSYKGRDVNKFNLIVLRRNAYIPSSVLVYLPFSIIIYSSLLLIRSIKPEWRRVLLLYITSIIIIIIFLNGFRQDNSLSSLLSYLYVHNLMPRFIFSALVNKLTNLQHFFAITFMCMSLYILLLFDYVAKKPEENERSTRKVIALVTLVLIISVPIILNFSYVHFNFYRYAIDPKPVPSCYEKAFDFIKNNLNVTYLWLPPAGTLKWRGSYLADIPGYLGGRPFLKGYFGVQHNYVKPFSKLFFKIWLKLKNGKVPYSIFEKYNIKYVVILTDYVPKSPVVWKQIVSLIKNDPHLRLVFRCGSIEIYVVKYPKSG